jgi:glycerol uptake facilitator-like aquaporin
MNSNGLFQINFVRWGLILGGVSVLLTLLINTLLGPDWPVRNFFMSMLVNLVLMATILILGINEKKAQQEGFLSYGESFLEGVIIFSIASILTLSFNAIYNYVIAPDSIEIVKQASIEVTEQWMEKAGASSKDINKAIRQIENQDFGFNIVSILKQLLGSVIFGAFICAIISIFTRKKRPMFDA